MASNVSTYNGTDLSLPVDVHTPHPPPSEDDDYNDNYYDSASDQAYTTASIVMGYVLFVLITGLNIAVLVALVRHKKDRNRVHFFILHLAIADLLVGAVGVLSETIDTTVGRWLAGDVACRIYRSVGSSLLCASNNLLVGMSVDRFLAVAAPMRFVKSGTKMAKGFVIGAWAISLIVSLFFTIYSEINEVGECELNLPHNWWKPYLTVLFMVIYVIPMVTIVVCYVGICTIIWRKWRQSQELSLSRQTHTKGDQVQLDFTEHKESRVQGGVLPKAKIKSIKMTVVICVAFVICWTPYFVFNMLSTYEVFQISGRAHFVINKLYPLNSVANPLIFILFNVKMFSRKSEPKRRSRSSSVVTSYTVTNLPRQ